MPVSRPGAACAEPAARQASAAMNKAPRRIFVSAKSIWISRHHSALETKISLQILSIGQAARLTRSARPSGYATGMTLALQSLPAISDAVVDAWLAGLPEEGVSIRSAAPTLRPLL